MIPSICFVLALCFVLQPTGLWAPSEVGSQPHQVSNDRYRAKLFAQTGYPDFSVTLQISDLKLNHTHELSVGSLFETVDELTLTAGEKLLVIGQLPQHTGVQIVIVDLSRSAVQDTVWTHYHEFALSPDRRYLIYSTFYGRLEPPNQRKSLLLVYDMTLPAGANRLSSAPNLSKENAGLPVFPKLNVQRSSYSIFEDPQNHVFISPFLWSEDSRRIVFFELAANERFLVLINGKAGLRDARILRCKIDLMANVDRSTIPAPRRADLEANPPRFSASDLMWHPSEKDTIVAKLETSDYWLPNELVLKLPTVEPSN